MHALLAMHRRKKKALRALLDLTAMVRWLCHRDGANNMFLKMENDFCISQHFLLQLQGCTASNLSQINKVSNCGATVSRIRRAQCLLDICVRGDRVRPW
jgi:hypothetical protein